MGDASHCKAMGAAQGLLCPRPANNNNDHHCDLLDDDDEAHGDAQHYDDHDHSIEGDDGEDEDYKFIFSNLKTTILMLMMKLRLVMIMKTVKDRLTVCTIQQFRKMMKMLTYDDAGGFILKQCYCSGLL